VVAVLSSCKMQVFVGNSTLDEKTFCKGKTCYFLKMRQTISRLTSESRSYLKES